MNPRQKFLERALAVGLECGAIIPADVAKHCGAEVLANGLPPELKAKLLQACLAAPKMDADLIVEVIGSQALAENLPMHVVWQCIAEAAGRAIGDASIATAASAPKASAPKASAPKAPSTKAPAESAPKSKSTPLKKPKADKIEALPKPPARGGGMAAKLAAKVANRKGVTPATNRTKVPRSEFDVDTDVGEDVEDEWDDDIVEVVEEDVIGGSTSVLDEIASEGGVSDFSRDEETVTRDVNKR